MIDCYMENNITANEKEDDYKRRTAVIDTGAGGHVWRLDTGINYLRNVREQRGKYVVGITGHKSPLTHKGDHDILKVINLGEVTTNLISLIKILDDGGSIEGDPSKCIIKNDVGKIIITGNREKGKMYTCILKDRSNEVIESMNGDIISNDGVVQDRHLTGEEINRAKQARMLHNSLHISENKISIRIRFRLL